MTNTTTPLGRNIMAVVAVLIGLFLMIAAPYIVMQALNPVLHRLIEVFQVQQPDGVWDTPVPILSTTYHVWLAAMVFAGAGLVAIANAIRTDKKWARPVAVTLMAIPSIGGMTMVIPWLVLVMGDALGNKNPAAGAPAALPIMVIGLVGYYIMLLTEKADWKTKVAQATVFTTLGVVGGFVFMNAQHGVRYFLALPSQPLFVASESNPELFLGGFVMYAAVSLFVVAIGLLAARKESGYYVGLVAGIVTLLAALLSFIDRQAVGAPSAAEWLRGAMLSGVMIAVLIIPFFKNRVLGLSGETETDEIGAKTPKAETVPA